ncbi:FKBP-type peptidyl-prolyl cis-trans isomerase [Pseudomonas chlororaphis subsp. aurantiaca]|nr:FKBP-type peptidyl-prolyl cis-trans isomerase [Pseudomonas chlororaphis]WMJ02252.1 FKBP-type peptidyl-prolyl cis-trans isomerase [Pseudomonas chlororaphis subsp. aurantiaca]
MFAPTLSIKKAPVRGERRAFAVGLGTLVDAAMEVCRDNLKNGGWDQGLMGMQVGGKRKLLVPAHLGYGERSMGKNPPNSNLVFEIELLEVLTRDD